MAVGHGKAKEWRADFAETSAKTPVSCSHLVGGKLHSRWLSGQGDVTKAFETMVARLDTKPSGGCVLL